MAERLLTDGGKVKVTIMFRGREITYASFGRRLLDRMAVDMTNIAIMEREPKLEGKNMFMILAPRAVPLGPPKFTHVKDAVVDAAAKAQDEEPDHDEHDDEHHDDVAAEAPEAAAPVAETTNVGSATSA